MVFDKAFQSKVVSLLLRSPQHARQIAALLQPEWIEDDTLGDVAEVAVQYVRKYGGPPTKTVISQECGADVVKSRKWKRLFETSVMDCEWVSDKFAEFCRSKALHAAILDAAKALKNGQTEGLDEPIRKAMSVGRGFDDLGTRLSEFDVRSAWYGHRQRASRMMPTGFGPLDAAFGGGLGAGELGIIMASYKMRKSYMLANLAVNALSSLTASMRDDVDGVKVVFITAELSKEKTFRRIDKIIASQSEDTLIESPTKFMREVKTRWARLFDKRSDLVVQGFPSSTVSPSDIRRYVETVGSQWGWSPDLIVIDYLDELAADNKRSEPRFELSETTRSLRGLAGIFNCPVWTATQATRGAADKEVVTANDAAEDIGKIRIADAVITLSATAEEKVENRMRAMLAAMRDSPGNIQFDLEVNPVSGHIRVAREQRERQLSRGDTKDRQDEQIDKLISKRKR